MENATQVVEVNAQVELDSFAGKDGFARLITYTRSLEERITQLESKNQTSCEKREMTEDDARRIMFGDLVSKTHKECETILGLTYGQIYSCRLGHTFKKIHVEAKTHQIVWTKK